MENPLCNNYDSELLVKLNILFQIILYMYANTKGEENKSQTSEQHVFIILQAWLSERKGQIIPGTGKKKQKCGTLILVSSVRLKPVAQNDML